MLQLSRKRGKRVGRILALAVLAALGPMPCRADRAVVVGVQAYTLPGAADLKGCVNDAKAMEEVLKRRGFRVRRLLDAEATKAAILKAIGDEGGQIRSDERFVFYFAGHGTNYAGFKNGRTASPGAFLLPVDADPKDVAGRFISARELGEAVAAVPAASRTVILDSCFSGGMSQYVMTKGVTKRPTRSRYWYPTWTGKGPVPEEANGRDGTSDVVQPASAGASICYYTAAKQDQKAYEWDYDKPHGIFTHTLVTHLKNAPEHVVWNDLHTKISSEVSSASLMGQQPLLAPPPFLDKAPFADAPPAQHKPLPLKSVWEAFHRERPGAGEVSLTITPNKKSLPVKRHFLLRVDVGTPGYLVLIEKFLDDKFYVLFPQSLAVKDAYVDPAQDFEFSNGVTYYGDAPGAQVVKAFLFRSRADAVALLEPFAATKGVVELARIKNLVRVPASQNDFFTSQIVFEITPADASGPVATAKKP